MSELEKATRRARDAVRTNARVQKSERTGSSTKKGWQLHSDLSEEEAADSFRTAFKGKTGLSVEGTDAGELGGKWKTLFKD